MVFVWISSVTCDSIFQKGAWVAGNRISGLSFRRDGGQASSVGTERKRGDYGICGSV